MNKNDLVSAVAVKAGLSKKDSEAAVNALLATVEETLVQGEKVVLVGFGTFEVKERPERQGRNPKTMENITIPASKTPVFKAGKGLKDKVNG
ncbi:MAG: HU family DNA-binding protein [Clostridia bacterium]|nr:HU family DNA-binding protein [Clostridia bacterium]